MGMARTWLTWQLLVADRRVASFGPSLMVMRSSLLVGGAAAAAIAYLLYRRRHRAHAADTSRQKFVDSQPFIEPLEVSFFDQM